MLAFLLVGNSKDTGAVVCSGVMSVTNSIKIDQLDKKNVLGEIHGKTAMV
jgi:hypothetical protein